MAANTMDNDVRPTTAGEDQENHGENREEKNREENRQDNDPEDEIAFLRDRLMRALAETENARRQGERRVQDAQQFAIANFAREMLQVVDNLRRALEAGATDGEAGRPDGLMEGVAATDRILAQILNRFGIREVDALNASFDPGKHEAVLETVAADQAPGSVVQVLENGYTLHDRLLRPARVVVAKAPSGSQQDPSRAAER
jgi:molecular chaperone GrpE